MDKNFRLTITDENGKELFNIKSDCIIFAANDNENNQVAAGSMANANTRTIMQTVDGVIKALDATVKSSPVLDRLIRQVLNDLEKIKSEDIN